MKNLVQKYYKVFGLLILFLGYLSWGFLTVSYRGSLFLVASFTCTLITWVIYILVYLCSIKRTNDNLCRQQLRIINDLIVFFGIILVVALVRGNIKTENLLFAVVSLGWVLLALRLRRYSKKNICNINVISKFLKRNVGIILLLLVVSVFSYNPMWRQFKWDGLLYYETCKNLDLTSISSLAIYGHIAQTYGALVKVSSLLIGDVAMAMSLMNVILLLISIIAFYGIIKIILPKEKTIIYILATSIYAYAPFNLGMVNYHNLDFYLQCIFPVVVYFTLKKQWIFQCIAALAFCFTKEPAILIYGCFCIGIVVVDIFCCDKKCFLQNVKVVFMQLRYYYMAVPGILWIITYKVLGPWSAGEGGIELDVSYMSDKLTAMYILNFNWIYMLLLVTLVLFIIIRKRGDIVEREIIIPLLLGQTAFTIFSCVFKTVNHPRYLDTTFFVICLLSIFLWLKIYKGRYKAILLTSISILMLISSYWTIDPISKYMFKTVDIGETKMVTTGGTEFGDAMIYNKQMLGMENVINQALSVALSKDAEIIFPAIGNSTYFIDGMSEVTSVEGDYNIQIQHWNKKYVRREPEASNETLDYKVYHILPDSCLNELKGKTVGYVYLDSVSEEYTENVLEQIDISEMYDFGYQGWKINLIIGNVI